MFRGIDRFARGGTSSPRSSPHSQTTEDTASNNEIALYTSHQFASTNQDDLNLLEWWRQHESMFPILSKMARDVHWIPVSTVSSESAFCSSGRILDDRRQSLKPEMVEALTIYKEWCQHEQRSQETFLNIDLVDNFDMNFQNMTINEM